MTERLLLVGPGGHAVACIDVVEQTRRYEIAGFVGMLAEVGRDVLGYPVIAADEALPRLLRDAPSALVTIGQIKTPEPRIRVFDALKAAGATLPVIVSPLAYVSKHAHIGEGTIVMHGAVVNAGARVGRNCIINTMALVEHEAEIGDHCHVSTTAAVNSTVRIGAGTFIGSGAKVRQFARIGERCVIGMGQAVVADCPDGTWLPRKVAPR